MKKVSLYKFTHTPLLKNDDQLKQKSDKQLKKGKKKQKTKQNKTTITPIGKGEKKGNVQGKKKKNRKNCPCASAHRHFRPLNSLIFSLQFFSHFCK